MRQLTGHSKSSTDPGGCPKITAKVLNNHYASISSDPAYRQPHIKQTVNCHNKNRISSFKCSIYLTRCVRPQLAWTIYRRDSTSWCTSFRSSIADLMSLSLDMSVVPIQWKRASILPIPKVNIPVSPSDFRPNINHACIVKVTGAYSNEGAHLPITQTCSAISRFLRSIRIPANWVYHSSSHKYLL